MIGKKYEGKTDKKEKWYGTDYKIEPISNESLEVSFYVLTTRLLFSGKFTIPKEIGSS